MDGDLSQALLVSRMSAEYLGKKPHHLAVFPYIRRIQKETNTSFLVPFSQSSLHMPSMHETSPGNGSRCFPAQKALMWGKVPYKERIFTLWATHTFSLGRSYKGNRTKHVHINRSYIHRQRRVQEWHSFICLWLISQSFTSFCINPWFSLFLFPMLFPCFSIWNV